MEVVTLALEIMVVEAAAAVTVVAGTKEASAVEAAILR